MAITTEINTIIARYISTGTRLIIPDLGTLLRRKESGEIVFMEMLKKNDGALVALVAEGFGIDEEQAAEAVNAYISTIKSALTSENKFIMDGVGVLLTTADGDVTFIFNPNSHSIPNEPEEEATVVTPQPQPAPAPQQPNVEPPVKTPQPEVSVRASVSPKVDVLEFYYEEPAETETAPEDSEYDEEDEESMVKKEERVSKESHDTPRKPRTSAPKKHIKFDFITILALVSAVIAIAVLIWGMIPNRTPLDVEVPVEVVEE